MLNNLLRHTGVGQYPGKVEFKVVAVCNQAKHQGGLDSGLRQNDE